MWAIFFLHRASVITIYTHLLCHKKWCSILHKGSSSKISLLHITFLKENKDRVFQVLMVHMYGPLN